MALTTSVFLDFVRFIAALAVFLGHLSGARFTAGIGWQVSNYMADSVALFFILSGYVIAAATAKRENTPRQYCISRTARVMSVAAPAILLTNVLDLAGRHVSPGLYDTSWGYSTEHPLLQLVLPITFTAQIWHIDIAPGSNLPWWSLCYEVLYYAAFGAFLFGGRWRWVAAGGIVVLMGPAVAAMFPLWLGGVALQRYAPRVSVSSWMALLLAVTAMGFTILFLAEAWRLPSLQLGFSTKHLDLLRSYLVGAIFVLWVLAMDGLSHVRPAVRLAQRVRPPVRWAASLTFTVYLMHLPVAQFIAAASGLPPSSLAERALVLGGTALAMLPLAWVGEWRKDQWARMLNGSLRPRYPVSST